MTADEEKKMKALAELPSLFQEMFNEAVRAVFKEDEIDAVGLLLAASPLRQGAHDATMNVLSRVTATRTRLSFVGVGGGVAESPSK